MSTEGGRTSQFSITKARTRRFATTSPLAQGNPAAAAYVPRYRRRIPTLVFEDIKKRFVHRTMPASPYLTGRPLSAGIPDGKGEGGRLS
jgi:hypothetical protein